MKNEVESRGSWEKSELGFGVSPDSLRITIVTWNLLGSVPSMDELLRLFKSKAFEEAPEVIMFGTQQCQSPLPVSFFCEGKQRWEDMLQQMLNAKYTLHSSLTMQGLHSAVFIIKPLFTTVTLQGKNYLKAGFCNMIGNKGAISLQVNVHGQNLQFLNCHLSHHETNAQKRNQTILRILNELVNKDFRTQVFFCGDLNYRIEMNKHQYKQMIRDKQNTELVMNYRGMLGRDQLRIQQVLTKPFLGKFHQEKIDFPPTYKLSLSSDHYSPQRIPGWTDRIFHRNGRARQIYYVCEYDIKGSDHRPVLATYDLVIEEGLSVFPQEFVVVQPSSYCNLI